MPVGVELLVYHTGESAERLTVRLLQNLTTTLLVVLMAVNWVSPILDSWLAVGEHETNRLPANLATPQHVPGIRTKRSTSRMRTALVLHRAQEFWCRRKKLTTVVLVQRAVPMAL